MTEIKDGVPSWSDIHLTVGGVAFEELKSVEAKHETPGKYTADPVIITIVEGGVETKHELALTRVCIDEKGRVCRFEGWIRRNSLPYEIDSGIIAEEFRLPRDQYPALHW